MFKRLLVLAVAMALFVTTFFIYFHIADARIEAQFRQEREKYHVENTVLTASDSTGAPSPVGTANPASAPAVDSNVAPVSPNALIGPVPPASLPDSSAAPATPDDSTTPATPSTNAPATPASTLIYPGLSRLPLALLGAYETNGTATQAPASPVPVPETATNPVPEAVTNATVSNTKTEPATNAAVAAPTATNGAPEIPSEGARHAPVSVPSSIIVLGYHQFTGPGVPSKNIYSMRQDVFEQEMKYLKDNNYHVVPLSDVVRFINHEIGLPPNSVAVTIDDGYKSPILWAAPVLKKYNFPWTFFCYPDFITVAEGKGAASWNDLLQLQADGVDIECHSKSHPIMTKKGSKTSEEYDTWLTAETAGAKATLEQHLGKPVRFFAYPYGAWNKEVEAKVVQAGFEAIFTVANNPVHPTTDIHAIGRYIITTPVEKAFAAYLRQGALAVAETNPAPGATISDPRPVITAVLGYAGTLDPATISTDVRDFGEVRHDFDPKTSTVRLYLPRDLIDSEVVVNIRAKDAGQTMIASWRFNYAPTAAGTLHAPIPTTVHAAPATPRVSTTSIPAAEPSSNAVAIPATNRNSTNGTASVSPAVMAK